MPSKPSAAPSQHILDIDAIRDGVLVLKNGALRAVLMASSLNFDLKSEVEQEAIIAGYQEFLNSLDFQVQLVVHSRRLDIEHYLAALAERTKDQPNELLRVQVDEYIQFIRSFVEMANIMQKFFYVVVPFALTEQKSGGGLFSGLTGLFGGGGKTKAMDPERFAEYKTQLWQRVELVASGLARLDVRTVPLTNEELFELFRSLYRPGIKEHIGPAQLEALGITTGTRQEAKTG
ncbi:MAG: hypothetical protein Q8R13_05925 [bacterium]|nr:hypothetical protein [bacterium]MDZ4296171.1 hypothetical protein [Patescibacteria group bacterium]